MVRGQLTDFATQKDTIVSAVNRKVSLGLFDETLHNQFKIPKINIQDVEQILGSIEIKLRKIEMIYHTFFSTEYDANIIVNDSLVGDKIIETEFSFDTKVITNRIEINDSDFYRELIDTNFQTFILTVSSLYENIARLIDTLLKKIVVYGGGKVPHSSVTLILFCSYWKTIVELGYRNHDDFYNWLLNHRAYIDKYLDPINRLRNSFIHGYSINLEIDQHSKYVVIDHTSLSNGSLASSDLVIDTFVQNISDNTCRLIEDLLNLFQLKLSHGRTKIPM